MAEMTAFADAVARYCATRDAGLLGPAAIARLARIRENKRFASLKAGDRDPVLWAAYVAADDECRRARPNY